MKKYTYKKYIQTMMLAVAVIPFFSSCDYLDKEPDDMLTIDAVFDNADYTKQWLALGEFDPKNVTVEELGLYMAGAKRM